MSNPWDSDPVVKATPSAAAPWANDPAVAAQPSGYWDQAKEGMGEMLHAAGRTLEDYTGKGPVGTYLQEKGKAIEPQDYVPAPVFGKNGQWSNIGLALAHGAPAIGGGIAAGGIGALTAPLIGVAAPVGALTGAGAYGMMTSAGPEADEAAARRTGDPNATPNTADKIRGVATAGAETALGTMLPVARVGGYLKSLAGPLAKTGVGGVVNAGKSLIKTTASQGVGSAAADAAHQAGQTIGTPSGFNIDPNEVANAGAEGAAAGTLFGLRPAARESLDAMKYRELNTPELRQAATQVANRVKQNAAGANLDGRVMFTGNAQKAGEAATQKTGLDIHTELNNAVSDLRSRTTLPVDADNVLNAALKGQTPTDAGYAQLAAAMGNDPQGANVVNLLHQQHAFDVLNNSGYHQGEKFRGGLGGFGTHILTGEHVTKTGLAALGGAAFEGGAGHLITFSPQVLAAVAGARVLGRLADNLTGAQSPAGRFVRNFADGTTPIRESVTQPPAAPAAPEAAPFPRAPVAGGPGTLPMIPPAVQAQMAARANLAKLSAAPEPQEAVNPLALPASITKPARSIMAGAKLRADSLGQAEAQKEIAQSPLIEQKLNGQPMPTPAAAKYMRQGMGNASTLARIQSDPEAEAKARAAAKLEMAKLKANGKAQPQEAKGAQAPAKEQEAVPQIAEPAPQVTKVVKANGATQKNDEPFPPSSYGHLPADEASKLILKQAQDSGKFIRIPEKYRASTQTRIERERVIAAALKHQHPNLPADLAARLEATSNQAEAQAFREHYKQAFPEAAAAFDKHLSDEKIASLWTKKRK